MRPPCSLRTLLCERLHPTNHHPTSAFGFIRNRRHQDRQNVRKELRRNAQPGCRCGLTFSTPLEHFMIPQKFAPLLFGLILAGLMSLLASGISMVQATGLIHGFIGAWTSAWLTAW